MNASETRGIVPESEGIIEATWIKGVSMDPAFDFLKDLAEDVYSTKNGEPFHDEGLLTP